MAVEIRKEGPTVQAWFIKSIGKYVVNLSAGCLTPPYASVLYFGLKIGHAEFGEMMKNTAVFLLIGYLPIVLLTTYIEPISMALPRLFGLV